MTATDPVEITNILNRLKPKKSSGHDGLTPILIKKCVDQLSYPISVLVNMSITEGSVPSCLKLAKIVPIYKSKANDDFCNYRRVSLLPVVSKVLGKVVNKILVYFF